LLLDRHAGEVPNSREQLEALPGVGRKTANVILNTAFGKPLIAVDTHVFRVSNRTGIAPGKDALAVERALHKTVPDEFKQHAHHWLILLGRHTCTARIYWPSARWRPWPGKRGRRIFSSWRTILTRKSGRVMRYVVSPADHL